MTYICKELCVCVTELCVCVKDCVMLRVCVCDKVVCKSLFVTKLCVCVFERVA